VHGARRLSSVCLACYCDRAEDTMNWFANLLKTLNRVAAALSPNCRQASRLQSRAMDSKLPVLQNFGLKIHLVLCKWCRRYGRQIRFLRDAAHDHPEELVKPLHQGIPDEARERIKRRLDAETK
jgi:hypothetical protein